MDATIIACGDELTFGQRVDTNSAWLSKQLASIGVNVVGHITVPDDQSRLERAFHEAGTQSDVILITGGIGPTADDLTRQALAAVMRQELTLNDAWLQHLRAFFRSRGREMPPTNRIQAMVPLGAKLINNAFGTAGGIDATLAFDRPVPDRAPQKHTCRVFAMPGVPKEMFAMFTSDVLPHLQGGGGAIVSRALHTFGQGESVVAEQLGDLMKRGRNPSVGTNVSAGIVTLRLNSQAQTPAEAQRLLDETDAACRAKLGELVYGVDEQTIAQIVVPMLIERRLKVTVAESCTGGWLGKLITDVPGSSACFEAGFITYSNKMKYERLGVSTEMINVYGAVSEPVVTAMAKNAKRLANANIALSISGIAGPGGGSEAKPVGTVWIGLAIGDTIKARQFNFIGDREAVRDRAAKMALTLLRFELLGVPTPF